VEGRLMAEDSAIAAGVMCAAPKNACGGNGIFARGLW